MNKEKLVADMIKCLKMHDQEFREDQVKKYIDNWAINKASLIDVLRKHPRWNEDIMAVAFDYDTEREINYDIFDRAFSNIYTMYILTLSDKITKFRTYESMEAEFGERANPRRIDCCYGSFGYNNRGLCGTEVTISRIDTCDGEVYLKNPTFTTNIRMFEEWNIYKVFDFLSSNAKMTFADDEFVKRYAELGYRCNVGQKMSRILSRFFTSVGLDKCDNYEHYFAELADAINPVKITRHTLLSVHPCDYLHMSYGGDENSNSWKSCHNIDNGCYMAGTLSYLLDPVSMIFYTVNRKYDGDCFWEQPKINRQVYAYENYMLLQSRLYPSYSDALNICNFRNVVQQIFAIALGENNLWDLKKSDQVTNYVVSADGAKNYPDYSYSDYNSTISLLHGHEFTAKMIVGANPPCLKCGKLYTDTNELHCDMCDYVQCAHCGSLHKENEMRSIEGQYYCDNCIFYCEDCETYHFEPTHIAYGANGFKRHVCSNCLQKYVRCEVCGNYMAVELTSEYGNNGFICCNCISRAKKRGEYHQCNKCKKVFIGMDNVSILGECNFCYEETHRERTA